MKRTYTIVIKNLNNKSDFIQEMESSSGLGFIPNRICKTAEHLGDRRVLRYELTEEEAKALENDPRVEAIQQKIPIITKRLGMPTNQLPVIPIGFNIYEEKETQIKSQASSNYRLSLNVNASILNCPDGKDVDVVVVDGHIDPNNPEFFNSSGVSRVNQINWFSVIGYQDIFGGTSYNYEPYVSPDNLLLTDDNNHGAHVAGTITGISQGWAKNANIYNISPYHQLMIDYENLRDLYLYAIKVWHQNKQINPVYGNKNPTITNHSYGQAYQGPDIRYIKEVNYRGVKHVANRNYTNANAVATVSSGRITSISLPFRGVGIKNEPTVSFYGGGQLTATAILGKGSVSKVVFTNPGLGYTSAPTITFSAAPPGGERAEAVLEIGSYGQINNIIFTKRGSGYITPPTITISNPPLSSPTAPPGVSPRKALAVAEISSGFVKDIVVTKQGTNYLDYPTVVFSGGGKPTESAEVEWTADLPNLGVGSMRIKNYIETEVEAVGIYMLNKTVTVSCLGGSGYSVAPIVSFYGGNSWSSGRCVGNKPEVRAIMGAGVNQGKVVGFRIINAGRGYTSAPRVVLTNGGGFTQKELEGFGLLCRKEDAVGPTNGRIYLLDPPAKDIAMEADLIDLMNAGVIVIAAAGNDSYKIDVEGGVDYNNKVKWIINSGFGFYSEIELNPESPPKTASEADIYYHRGGSPDSCGNTICVGAANVDAPEYKTWFSRTGPGVDVYAPGDYIISTTHTISGNLSIRDPRNNNYWLSKYRGTSMASPQVAGVLACVAQSRRDLNQAGAREFLENNSRNTVQNTNGGYTDTKSLQGGSNRYLFLPGVSFVLDRRSM